MKHAATREELSERGVVTYVGLMFAMLIAASAWSTLGTGDAILAKLRSQELADASVYSSAVTNAQGMNFVATLNVAMLALTGTYVAAQKVVNVLDTAVNVNPNTSDGKWATGLAGDTLDDGWMVTKNWGSPDVGVKDVLGCAKNGHSCAKNDVRATCDFIKKTTKFQPFGDVDYCGIANQIESARSTMAGGGEGDEMGKVGLQGFRTIVVGKAFPQIASMQNTIATTQGSLGEYLGSTMKQSGAVQSILDNTTSAHVVTMGTKGGGNYQGTAAMKPSSSIEGTSLFVGQLPVTPHKAGDLCLYLGANNNRVDSLRPVASASPLESLGPTSGVDSEVGRVANQRAGKSDHATFGGAILSIGMSRDTQCGDGDVWNHDPTSPTKLNGPMLIAGGPAPAAPGEKGLQNGGVGFQSVSMITSKMPSERATLAVKPFGWFSSLGKPQKPIQEPTNGDGAGAANAPGKYRAQGEFYLDCARNRSAGRWDDPECNGQNLAMFRLQWRARLTPLPPTSPALTASGLGAGGTPGDPTQDGSNESLVGKKAKDLPMPRAAPPSGG